MQTYRRILHWRSHVNGIFCVDFQHFLTLFSFILHFIYLFSFTKFIVRIISCILSYSIQYFLALAFFPFLIIFHFPSYAFNENRVLLHTNRITICCSFARCFQFVRYVYVLVLNEKWYKSGLLWISHRHSTVLCRAVRCFLLSFISFSFNKLNNKLLFIIYVSFFHC